MNHRTERWSAGFRLNLRWAVVLFIPDMGPPYRTPHGINELAEPLRPLLNTVQGPLNRLMGNNTLRDNSPPHQFPKRWSSLK